MSIQCYDHEVLWLSVAAKNHGHVVVGAVYRLGSGHGGDTQLLDHLDTTIDEAERYGSHIVITGDFNVHNQSWLRSFKTTRAGEFMEEIWSLHGLYQHVTSATQGSNMLDLVISNFTSPVGTSNMPVWGSPTNHQSLQASPSPFSESRRLQGESGGTSLQNGHASGTFTAQQTGKRSSHL